MQGEVVDGPLNPRDREVSWQWTISRFKDSYWGLTEGATGGVL